MITHGVTLLFSCRDDGNHLIATAQIVEALRKQGFEVEEGYEFIVVRKAPNYERTNSH